jgi:hypothetical protein
MQRSSWGGSILALALYFVMMFNKGDYKTLMRHCFSFLCIGLVLSIFLTMSGIDLSFLFRRIENFDGGVSGRSGQWVSGIHNFMTNPIGAGSGQIGQVGARYITSSYLTVPDGDFFRMLSEYGISAIVLIFTSALLCLLLLCFKKLAKIEMCVVTVIISCAFQMIGSNITEFYFNNFIFWIFMGKLVYVFRIRFLARSWISGPL